MFDAARTGRSWWWMGAGGALVVGAAVLWARPELGQRALQQLDLASSGVPVGATLWPATRNATPYADSPLQLAMVIEGAWVPVDVDAAVGVADGLATSLSRWMLQQTGASSPQAAEAALWEAGRIDDLLVHLATLLREAQVHARASHRLSQPEPEGQPVYVHPDDLAWLAAHVAWRLDLHAELVRSPIHHYLVFRSPDGERSRAFEATCFRRVDALGVVVPHDQPSVGRRLVLPEDHYPRGVGGIRNPTPLPPGAYATLDDVTLFGALVERLTARHGTVDEEALCEVSAAAGVRYAPCEVEAP